MWPRSASGSSKGRLLCLVAALVGAPGCLPAAPLSSVLGVPRYESPTPAPTLRPEQVRVVTEARPLAWHSPTPRPTPSPVERLAPATATAGRPQAVSEEEGEYVTSTLRGARYYYHWSDDRWKTLRGRVWFRTRDDLLAAFPHRRPAP